MTEKKLCERCGDLVLELVSMSSGCYADILWPNGTCMNCVRVLHPDMQVKLWRRSGDKRIEMPSDEEILIERMKEWNDRDSCPHPMHQPIAPPALMKPYGKQPSDAAPPKVEPKQETWRDRAIKNPLF